MSAALTALLPASFRAVGGVYSVAGSSPAIASRWSHRFAFSPVDISGLTGATVWRLALDDGALTYPSPPDSTGSTTPTATPVLDIVNLAQGVTLTPRARLENTPPSAISIGTCTISAASPMVVTHTAHGLSTGDQVRFTTTGALPGPLVVGTTYYVRATSLLADSFTIATTEGGAGIAFTSGAGSGTHTLTLFKAISAWINADPGTFSTGAVLTVAPPMLTNPLHDVQVIGVDTTHLFVGWNSYPAQIESDFMGTLVIARVFPPPIIAGTPGAGTAISGLENGAQIPTSGSFSDGDEVNVVLYPAIQYPVDGFGAFVATGGVDTAFAYPADNLWTLGAGVIGTPNDSTPIAGLATVTLALGVPAAATWSYAGTGQATDWSIADMPPGVTISAPSAAKRIGVLDGTPTTEGIYYGRVSCRAVAGYTRHVASYPVTFIVTGRLCLAGIASDPLKVDLQLMQRGRTVESFFFGGNPAQITRGETVNFIVVIRTGTHDSPGGIVDPSAFKALRFALLEEGNLDAEPWLEAEAPLTGGSTVVVTSLGGANVIALPLLIASDKLDDQFAILNAGPGSEDASISIPAVLQLSYLDAAGKEVLFRRLPMSIVQDAAR